MTGRAGTLPGLVHVGAGVLAVAAVVVVVNQATQRVGVLATAGHLDTQVPGVGRGLAAASAVPQALALLQVSVVLLVVVHLARRLGRGLAPLERPLRAAALALVALQLARGLVQQTVTDALLPRVPSLPSYTPLVSAPELPPSDGQWTWVVALVLLVVAWLVPPSQRPTTEAT